MNELGIELTPQALVLIPLVAGIIQMIKKIPAAEKFKEWFPIAALALGTVLCYLMKIPTPVISGITIGLMSSGAYSALKGKTD